MKKITIDLNKVKTLKKQIEAAAKIANAVCETRYYLKYIQFEKLENSIRITATNGNILSDIIVSENLTDNFEVGEKVEIEAKAFLKIDKDFLFIEFDKTAKTALINKTIIAAILENEQFPQIDKIRIKTKPPITLCLNAAFLKNLAATLESDVVEITFDLEDIEKPYLINSLKSSGIIMPSIIRRKI